MPFSKQNYMWKIDKKTGQSIKNSTIDKNRFNCKKNKAIEIYHANLLCWNLNFKPASYDYRRLCIHLLRCIAEGKYHPQPEIHRT